MKRFGVMLDMSRNAVMKVSQLKQFILILEKIGYNSLQLYTEDTFEIEDEPFFGYMRGRYSVEELKEIDVFAKEHGIELIPCVQTLAHFGCLVRHATYQPIVDINDILLVDDERTYAFLDKMFATLAKTFTSRLVNIGMDEAHMVGLGAYLDKNGFHNRFELLIKHLNKVVEIAQKYGFKPQMWSDMFFRLACKELYDNDSLDETKRFPLSIPDLAGDGYYVDEPIAFRKEILQTIPKNVDLIYWDYYNVDEKVYDAMFQSHKKFDREIWFAGGAWCWNGFAPHNRYSLKSMLPAMKAVKKYGVENVMITLWGDDGKECSYYSTLPALYAIKQYADGNYDIWSIKTSFHQLFGLSFDDFMSLDLPNGETVVNGRNGAELPQNPCKSLFYNDPFLGVMDKIYDDLPKIRYNEYEKILRNAKERAGDFAYIFDCEAKLCKFLSVKADLGIRTRKIYRQKDKKPLRGLMKEYNKALKLLDDFYTSYSYLWHKENKAFGFEVMDIRIGGLRLRLQACKDKIKQYCNSKIPQIEELEEENLEEKPNKALYHNRYQHLATFGYLSE